MHGLNQGKLVNNIRFTRNSYVLQSGCRIFRVHYGIIIMFTFFTSLSLPIPSIITGVVQFQTRTWAGKSVLNAYIGSREVG